MILVCIQVVLIIRHIWRFWAGKQLSVSLSRAPGRRRALTGTQRSRLFAIARLPAATRRLPGSLCATPPTRRRAASATAAVSMATRAAPRAASFGQCQVPPACLPRRPRPDGEGGFWSRTVKLRSNFVIITDLSISCARFLLKRNCTGFLFPFGGWKEIHVNVSLGSTFRSHFTFRIKCLGQTSG